MTNRTGIETAVFYCAWALIILVSVVDGYLTLRHRHFMLLVEENPVGRALIEWNNGRVWYLLAAKALGTVMACAILLLIRRARPRLGLVISLGVAAFQLGLLIYLLFR